MRNDEKLAKIEVLDQSEAFFIFMLCQKIVWDSTHTVPGPVLVIGQGATDPPRPPPSPPPASPALRCPLAGTLQ